MTAALIIPALNEEAAIGTTLDALPKGMYRAVIVADNGSTDRTAEVARSRGAIVVREPERGYGAACLRAMAALPAEIDTVVFMDADASDDPADAEALVAPLRDGHQDFVLGSRELGVRAGRVEQGALQPHQRFGNWLATALIRMLYGHRFTDLGPFRAIRREALDRLGMRDRNYGWTIEMQIKAVRAGLRMAEVPVTYRRRIGVSKVSGNLQASIRAGVKIIWTVFRLALSPR